MKQYKIYSETIEPQALVQFHDAMKREFVVKGALLPDGHCGYVLPIGAVVACKDVITPSYVGYDQGCGLVAYKTGFSKSDIARNKKKIFDQIYRDLPVGPKGHKHPLPIDHKLMTDIKEVCATVGENFSAALKKLGTLGGGNHFCEIGYDEENNIWIIVHSGSRHFGHSVATHHMKVAAIENTDKERYANEFEEKNQDFKRHNPDKFEAAKQEFIYRRVRARLKTNMEGHHGLDVNSVEGKNYIHDMNVALEYALENRKLMVKIIMKSINQVLNGFDKNYEPELNEGNLINRNHNHAELKDGLWIHRKGATHAEKGMLGIIPGNMKDGSFIVKGTGNPDSLCSSSHGAGRVLSRKKAKAKLNLGDFEHRMGDVMANINKHTLDESPMAYKDIFEVMDNQKDLVEIIAHVKPIVNIKG